MRIQAVKSFCGTKLTMAAGEVIDCEDVATVNDLLAAEYVKLTDETEAQASEKPEAEAQASEPQKTKRQVRKK